MTHRGVLRSKMSICGSRLPLASAPIRRLPARGRRPIAPTPKGHSAPCHFFRHRLARTERRRTRIQAGPPPQNASFQPPGFIAFIGHRDRPCGARNCYFIWRNSTARENAASASETTQWPVRSGRAAGGADVADWGWRKRKMEFMNKRPRRTPSNSENSIGYRAGRRRDPALFHTRIPRSTSDAG